MTIVFSAQNEDWLKRLSRLPPLFVEDEEETMLLLLLLCVQYIRFVFNYWQRWNESSFFLEEISIDDSQRGA